MLTDPQLVKYEVQKAIAVAKSGRRGPVWLDIPLDIQSSSVDDEGLIQYENSYELVSCSDTDFNELIKEIKQSRSPLIIAGSAISSTHSHEVFRKAIQKWKIPVVGANIVSDVLSFDDELYYGTSGTCGTRTANYLVSNSDCILVLGCSLGFKQTTFSQQAFARNAKIIMVDINPDEAKKPGLNIYKFINCDISIILQRISNSEAIHAPDNWISYCNKLKSKFQLFESALNDCNFRVHSNNFWREYFYKEPEKNITILGNNSGIIPKLQYGHRCKNQRIVANLNCGSMGYDLPAAIGACTASRKEVVLVTGDGSIMMNLQEFQTIVTNKLPIKIVVFSNDGYRGIEQTCKNYFGGRNFGCTPESGISFPSFENVIKAFGIKYNKCSTNGEIPKALDWLFSCEGPCFLELLQLHDNPITPVLKPKLKSDGTSENLLYECMYPFLDEKEHKQCMFILDSTNNS